MIISFFFDECHWGSYRNVNSWYVSM